MFVSVAVTGASGAIYARLLLEQLCLSDKVDAVRLIFTRNGRDVADFEEGLDNFPTHEKLSIASNDDFYTSIASGSGGDDALVIIPCSVGMMSRIATGHSSDLISRGADVMLKERAKLIMVIRENPFNLIHLRNMVTLTEAGAIIMTCSPSFYTKPKSIEELAMTTVNIVMRHLGLSKEVKWPPAQ